MSIVFAQEQQEITHVLHKQVQGCCFLCMAHFHRRIHPT